MLLPTQKGRKRTGSSRMAWATNWNNVPKTGRQAHTLGLPSLSSIPTVLGLYQSTRRPSSDWLPDLELELLNHPSLLQHQQPSQALVKNITLDPHPGLFFSSHGAFLCKLAALEGELASCWETQHWHHLLSRHTSRVSPTSNCLCPALSWDSASKKTNTRYDFSIMNQNCWPK